MTDAAANQPSTRRRRSGRAAAPSTGQRDTPKMVDGFAKQLVSLAPAFWATFATGQQDVQPGIPLDPEFRLVFRQTDTLLPITDQTGRQALILFEFQTTYDPRIARRLNAYAALAEERYELSVFPVVVNFQPPTTGTSTTAPFESECYGLRVQRDFHTINLWELPATTAFEPDAASLLVLLPFLDGGDSVPLMERAWTELRHRTHPPELAMFLLYLVHKVGGDEALQRVGARLDMALLRQTNVFQDLIDEGLAEGRAQGRIEGRVEGLRLGIERILETRFGHVSDDVADALAACTAERLEALTTLALTVATLADFEAHLAASA